MSIWEAQQLRLSHPAPSSIPAARATRPATDEFLAKKRVWGNSRGMTILGLLLATLLFAACDGRGSSGSSGSSQSRSAEFDPAHPMYSRFEGDGAPNVCSSDLDCIVGGCSNEVCAAEAVMTTCEALGELPRGDCLCVASECLWAKPITEECSSDADCRTASNYCGSCSCEALAPGEEPTRCDVPVLCVMDPCDFMVAVCDRGTCVTTAGSR